VWCLGSYTRALACHVTIADIPPSESVCILAGLKDILHGQFEIDHTTIQFEHIGCEALEDCVCVTPPEEMAVRHEHHHGHVH
jgi:cobalt-zinc-cadmium efflux system protein